MPETNIIRETEIEAQLNADYETLKKGFAAEPGNLNHKTSHTIIHGSFIDPQTIQTIKALKQPVRLIVTSPPYNANINYGKTYNDNQPIQNYIAFLNSFLDASDQLLEPGGRIVINIRDIKIATGSRLPIIVPLHQNLCAQKQYNYRGVHLWYKGREESSTAWGSWKSSANPSTIDLFEYIYVFQKSGTYPKGIDNISKEEFIESNMGVWKIRPVKKIFKIKDGSNKNTMSHPCPFPLELPTRIIKLYSHVGDLVLDPFGGVGSTLIAAAHSGRNSVSVDISKDYCNTALNRANQDANTEPGLYNNNNSINLITI